MADFEERGRSHHDQAADSTRTCTDCSATFAFGAEEQRFFESRNLTPPKRCLTCRKARRAARDTGASPRDDDRRGPPPRGPSRLGRRDSGPSATGPSRFDARGDDRRPPPRREAGTFQGSAGYGGGERRPAPSDRVLPRDDRRPFDRPSHGPSFDPSRAPSDRRPSPAADASQHKDRPRFDITCQVCGVAAQVPFKPIAGRSLYCKPCYQARRTGGANDRPAPEPGTRGNE